MTMAFDVRNVIPAASLDVLRRSGLHKVAAAMLGVEELTLRDAVAWIAEKAAMHRAEARAMADGIEALAALRGEKRAGVWEALLQRSMLPAAGGAAMMALPELVREGPTDPDAVMNKALLGGAMGLAGGGLYHLHRGLQSNPAAAGSLAQTIAPRG